MNDKAHEIATRIHFPDVILGLDRRDYVREVAPGESGDLSPRRFLDRRILNARTIEAGEYANYPARRGRYHYTARTDERAIKVERELLA